MHLLQMMSMIGTIDEVRESFSGNIIWLEA